MVEEKREQILKNVVFINFYILIRRQDKEKKTNKWSVSNIIKDINIILFQSLIFSLGFDGPKGQAP